MKKAIRYIFEHESGPRKDLIKYLGGDENFVDELALLGYITQGTDTCDARYHRTWKKTTKADEYYQIFIAPVTESEKEEGRYLHALLKF